MEKTPVSQKIEDLIYRRWAEAQRNDSYLEWTSLSTMLSILFMALSVKHAGEDAVTSIRTLADLAMTRAAELLPQEMEAAA
jgi:hypothetical protein